MSCASKTILGGYNQEVYTATKTFTFPSSSIDFVVVKLKLYVIDHWSDETFTISINN